MSVIVNGFPKNIPYQKCVRCISDSTVAGIEFDKNGVCNFCDMHAKMEQDYPIGEEGKKRLNKIAEKIRRAGKGKKYDCIVGISGGRDSSFLLHLAVKEWNLRPLAVHFNDGFDNPVAGENMINITKKLNVELRTITSDFRECKDLKIAELYASTPHLNTGTDIGIAASLYGTAAKENVKYILFGQSFRTEGIKPISWAYFDGDYLRAVHKKFGKVPLRKWKPEDPGFHLGVRELFYYTMMRGIKVVAPIYNYNYVRSEAGDILTKNYDWVYTGAHYYDDLYWALINYIHRVKFNIDLRINSYSALIRSGQMTREEAVERTSQIYSIEDPKIISLCLKRLGLSQEEFDAIMKLPPKRFTDYPNSYNILRLFKIPIWTLTRIGFLPTVVYDKYFNFQEKK